MIYRFQEMYSNAITKIAYMTETLLADVRAAFWISIISRSCFAGRNPSE